MISNYLFSPEQITEENQEWMGVTVADILLYLLILAAISIWFVSFHFQLVILFISILFSGIMCQVGMRKNPHLPHWMNIFKVIVYPMSAGILLLIEVFTLAQ